VDIINRPVIEQAKKDHANWRGSLNSWETITRGVHWRHSSDVRRTFNTADPNVDGYAIFNIAHNEARLVALIDYDMQTVTVLEILTHKEYGRKY
jgi:mRNA interferase HigB